MCLRPIRPVRLAALALACALALAPPSLAQEGELPAEARERLAYAIGSWAWSGEILDPQGNVVRTMEGTQEATWLVPGRIVQMRDTDAGGGGGHSWWVWDERAGAWTLVSISPDDGAVWILKGDLERWVITSEPRPRPDGTTVRIRFTHHDIEPDGFQALMEVSLDGGATWRARSRQWMRRRR